MKKFFLVLLGIGVALFAAYSYLYESYSWHQKTTIEVQTSAGLKTGSSVGRMSRSRNLVEIGGTPPFASGFQGEATVVDMGQGRYLFGLLRGLVRTDMSSYAMQVYNDYYSARGREQLYQALARGDESLRYKVLTQDHYPLLVTFDDLNDPKSVRKVDPGNLAAIFGRGVRLKRITLELTDEKVTKGRVEKLLPCLLSGRACIPFNKDLLYGHPMRNILNSVFCVLGEVVVSISKELFLSILAMDSYNQGCDPGVKHGQTKIGSASIRKDSEEVFRDPNAGSGSQTVANAAGFYAVAYTVDASGVDGIGSDSTVISYRGTDRNVSPFWLAKPGSDAWNGYGLALGSAAGAQAHLAAEFFQAVTQTTTTDPRTGTAILTGHSLGGGLAGGERMAARAGHGEAEAA